MSLLVPTKEPTSYYAQSESTENTLLVAFCNLLKKFDTQQVNPALLKRVLDDQDVTDLEWNSISVYYDRIQVDKIGESNSWPNSGNAIVVFQITDHNEGKIHLNYCVVSNLFKQTFIDSMDGREKHSDTYGRPIAWASYILAPENEETEPIHEPPAPDAKDNRLHTITKREASIWGASRTLKLWTAEELAEHNGIEKSEMINIREGFVLHLPQPKEVKKEPTVGYKVLDEPRVAYVSKEGGAKKYSFGNVRKIEQITETGPTYKHGHTVTIVAEAHVPVEDNGESKILRFDMDANAYNVATNKPIHTIGYNWSHLSDGAYPPSEQPVQDPPKPAEEEEEEVVEQKPDIVIEKPKLPWKEQFALTYNPFSDGALWFTAKEDMLVRDMATVRQPRKLLKGQDVLLAGTFRIDGKLYGNPQSGANSGLAWAVPMHKVVEKIEEREDEKELYNTSGKPLKLNYKFNIKTGRLTVEERLVALPLSQTANLTNKAVKFVKQIKIRSK